VSEAVASIDYLRGAVPRNSGEVVRAIEISNWLTRHQKPGDTVQPLDWVEGGGVHALLLARAPLATRFLYNYHFYHHVSSPYTRGLREEFMHALKERKPRFIVEFDRRWSRISGEDTSPDFEELDALLQTDYAVVHSGGGFAILERVH
jgi:hypothetical protein